jgi:hypothetical protein
MTRAAASTRLNRWLMAVGAALTAIALLLLTLLPGVPATAAAIPGWVERGEMLLSWSDELLFFAIICWWVGASGLFSSHSSARPVRISVGMTALAVALGALLVLLLSVGRLVYPVFGIQLSADVLALVVSASFGALHLALLGFAVAAVALSWSTRSGLIGRTIGIAAAVVFLLGSFPWLTPSWWNSLVALAIAVWGVFLSAAATTPDRDRGDSTPRPDATTSR